MATMTVARALTYLKTTLGRIAVNNSLIKTYGGTNTKSLSKLSTHKDIKKNHERARAKVQEAIQSNEDLIHRYMVVSAAISKSNIETKINTEYFGEITVAEALVLTQSLEDVLKAFGSSLEAAIADSDKSAERYNNSNFKSDIIANLTPEQVNALIAQPEPLFDLEEYNDIKTLKDVGLKELNLLINESNAVTAIEVPEE